MVRQGSPALSRGSSMRHFDVVGGFGLRNVSSQRSKRDTIYRYS
jgi:hypothetical protein